MPLLIRLGWFTSRSLHPLYLGTFPVFSAIGTENRSRCTCLLLKCSSGHVTFPCALGLSSWPALYPPLMWAFISLISCPCGPHWCNVIAVWYLVLQPVLYWMLKSWAASDRLHLISRPCGSWSYIIHHRESWYNMAWKLVTSINRSSAWMAQNTYMHSHSVVAYLFSVSVSVLDQNPRLDHVSWFYSSFCCKSVSHIS